MSQSKPVNLTVVAAIAALILGAVVAYMVMRHNDTPDIDKAHEAVEEATRSTDIVLDAYDRSFDLYLQRIEETTKTVTERAVIVRDQTSKTVRALTPDSLVLSIDEFGERWRELAKHRPVTGSAGMGGD